MKYSNSRLYNIVSTFFMLFFSSLLFSLDRSPGDYVVYRDHTWKNPTWIGFLYYGEDVWGTFLKTPELDSNVEILFRTETVDDEILLVGQQIITEITPNDIPAVNYLMGLLPDLYKWSNEASSSFNKITATLVDPKRSPLLDPLIQLKRSSVNFGGDFLLTFASEIPVFGLSKAHKNESSRMQELLQLEKSGKITDGMDSDFFDFSADRMVLQKIATQINPNAKKYNIEIDGLQFQLDNQWQSFAENVYMLGSSAVLIVDTIDLAEQHIEKNIIPTLTRFFSISNHISWFLPESTHVRGNKDRFIIENLIYNKETGDLHIDKKLCVPIEGTSLCTVASLTVEKTTWDAYSSYFDLF